jgi:hypothetical protein
MEVPSQRWYNELKRKRLCLSKGYWRSRMVVDYKANSRQITKMIHMTLRGRAFRMSTNVLLRSYD